jgi:hypothetical protein
LKIVNRSKQGVCHVYTGIATGKDENNRSWSDIWMSSMAAIEARCAAAPIDFAQFVGRSYRITLLLPCVISRAER